MVVLLWLLVGLGFAYRWLCGGWFARIIMGVIFIPIVGYALLTAMWLATDHAGANVEGLIAACIGIPAGWWLAGLPARRAERQANVPFRGEAPPLLFPRD